MTIRIVGGIVLSGEILAELYPSAGEKSAGGERRVSVVDTGVEHRCRAALATLELLQNGYTANAAQRGEQLRQGLSKLQRQFIQLGDVRGLGLMVAVDVVRPEDRQTPDPAGRDEIVQTAFHQGLLLLGCGESALRFCPPLCITAAQVDTALRILAGVLADRKPEKMAI